MFYDYAPFFCGLVIYDDGLVIFFGILFTDSPYFGLNNTILNDFATEIKWEKSFLLVPYS